MKTEELQKRSMEMALKRLIKCILTDKADFLFLVWGDKEEKKVDQIFFGSDTTKVLGEVELAKFELLNRVDK
jgi:hypothetical protein